MNEFPEGTANVSDNQESLVPFFRLMYPRGMQVVSCGGNGMVNTRGIEIEFKGNHVLVAPITSQRTPAANCYLQLPADRDILRAIISQLRAIALVLEDPQTPQ